MLALWRWTVCWACWRAMKHLATRSGSVPPSSTYAGMFNALKPWVWCFFCFLFAVNQWWIARQGSCFCFQTLSDMSPSDNPFAVCFWGWWSTNLNRLLNEITDWKSIAGRSKSFCLYNSKHFETQPGVMCTTMLTQYCGNMKRHQIAFVSLIDFVVSIHAYQCMHFRQKHANLRNNLPGGMHGFRWATHWWGSSYYSPNQMKYTVCGAYSTRRKDASFFIGSVYSQSRCLMSNLTLMTFISAGEICLEHVCFRITCWFDSRKQLSRVKKFHRVYSLEVLWGFNVFLQRYLAVFLETHQESRSWIQTLQPRAWYKALDGYEGCCSHYWWLKVIALRRVSNCS